MSGTRLWCREPQKLGALEERRGTQETSHLRKSGSGKAESRRPRRAAFPPRAAGTPLRGRAWPRQDWALAEWGTQLSRLPPTSWIKEKVTGPFETKVCLLSGQERKVWADRCLLISCTFQNPWHPQDSRVVILSILLPASAPPSHPQKAVIKSFQDPGLSPPIWIVCPQVWANDYRVSGPWSQDKCS